MSYKKLLLSAMVLFSLHSCAGVSPDGMGYNVTVPLSVINTTVSQKFPQTKTTNYGTLLIDKPNILAKQGSNAVGVGTSFTFSNMFIPNGIKGSVLFSSGVRYSARDRGLYLVSPMVDELTFQNFSLSQYLTPQIREMIGDMIAQVLLKKPIYHMNDMGASFVKDIEIKNGNLLLTLGI